MKLLCPEKSTFIDATVAIRAKDSGYRSVKNGAVLSVVETYCSGTRHSGSVTHTAEDD